MAQAPRSRVDELKTQTEYPNGSGNGPLPRITARNPAMVMVMMLALMQACTQGLMSLVHGLLAAAPTFPLRDRLQTNCFSKQWTLLPAPIPAPSHSPPGG